MTGERSESDFEIPLPETFIENYQGDLAITCLDPILKNQLASILLGKYGEHDDWWYQNITFPIMRIPQCPTGNLVGFGKVRHWKRKRRKKRKRLPKIGIVELCREAKEFLARYDDSGKIKELPECDLVAFAEVESGEGVKIRTAYHEFIRKCVRDLQGPMKDRMRICAQRWHEEKKKKKS